MIVQVNQIGSVTESIEAVKMSKHAGWGVMASHRRYGTSTMSKNTHTKITYKKKTHTHTHTKIKTLALAFVLLMLSLCSM